MNAPSLMTRIELTGHEKELLSLYRASADRLANLSMELAKTGLSVQINMNIATGVCDRFEVHRSVKIDMP